MDSNDAQLDIIGALGADRGVLCLVGAGGKKTTMYALAEAHGGRVALSSTAHMYIYDKRVVDQIVLAADLLETPDPGARVVAFAGVTDTPSRVGGLQEAQLQEIWSRGGFDLMLIKADGARVRSIKAPADYEPLIPAFTDTVVTVVSAAVFGRCLTDKIAHRPQLAADVMGTTVDSALEPVHLARLLTSDRGSLKGVGTAVVRPLINMVDDRRAHELAAEAARLALAGTTRFDRVVLAAMNERRVVDVIER